MLYKRIAVARRMDLPFRGTVHTLPVIREANSCRVVIINIEFRSGMNLLDPVWTLLPRHPYILQRAPTSVVPVKSL